LKWPSAVMSGRTRCLDAPGGHASESVSVLIANAVIWHTTVEGFGQKACAYGQLGDAP